ncbi:DUF2726 domain-containing protein [Aquabacterium sp.]|uniref:DUF2726 domain-containing protein n=1 Tax=Aquabacterium sp. TaxID=1872578 RepID=UPI0025C6F05C|nr:DUF2726 domain-containing protein [Aquabacterium sp.]
MKADLFVVLAVLLAMLGGVLLGWALHDWRQRANRKEWPQRWRLNARPLFTAHERALYRELRAALPHHVIMAKVSLLRFCQAAEQKEAKPWFERLQALHVGLAVCTPNGAVISAIDIEHDLGGRGLRRSQRMKEAVLEACRVRYVRCLPGQWPPAHLLAGWALGQGVQTHGEQPHFRPYGASEDPGAEAVHDASDLLARKLRQRRAERAARWAESSFAQDSFFAFDSRLDAAANSSPAPLGALPDAHAAPATDKAANAPGTQAGSTSG